MQLNSRATYILIIVSVLLFAATILFSNLAPDNLVSPALKGMVPFFLLTSLISRLILHKAFISKKAHPTNTILSISTGKFFLFFVILLAYSLIFRDDAVTFILSFFIFYAIFTLLDIIAFANFLSKENN